MIVPKLNSNADHVELSLWRVADLESVRKGQALADLSTSKAAVVIEAESDGFVRRLHAEGSMVGVGSPIALVFSDRAEAAAFAAPAAKPALPGASPGFTRLSRLAAEGLTASGKSEESIAGLGLVSSRILARSLPMAEAGAAPVVRSRPAGTAKLLEIEALAAGQVNAFRSSITVALSAGRIQKAIDDAGLYGGSVLPIVLREFCAVAKTCPYSTAFFENGLIRYYDRVNLGIVVDLGYGIRVPVLRDADRMTADEVNAGMLALCLRYQDRTLTDADMSGSTVTVTDLSRQNVLQFEPLLQGRQSAILAVGGDRAAEGYPLTLTLAFDHRVINGREAATLLNQVKERILK